MNRKAKHVRIHQGGIAEIARQVKAEKNPRIKERLQIILWAAQKESNAEIARRLNRTDHTVAKWIKRWNKLGYEGLIDVDKPGRPSKITNEGQSHINNKLTNRDNCSRVTCKAICIELKELFGIRITEEGIRKRLHRDNYSWKKPKKRDYRQNEELKQEFEEELKKRKNLSVKIQSFGT